jgi:hypothetical protein
MKTTFDSFSADRYAFTHGHRPRGFGQWIFGLGRNGAWTNFTYTGTYSVAKAAALREARSIGCTDVTVYT